MENNQDNLIKSKQGLSVKEAIENIKETKEEAHVTNNSSLDNVQKVHPNFTSADEVMKKSLIEDKVSIESDNPNDVNSALMELKANSQLAREEFLNIKPTYTEPKTVVKSESLEQLDKLGEYVQNIMDNAHNLAEEYRAEVELDVSNRVAEIYKNAMQKADSIQTDAQIQADEVLEQARKEADFILSQRIRIITGLTNSMIQRATIMLDQDNDDVTFRNQVVEMIDAVEKYTELLVKAVEK